MTAIVYNTLGLVDIRAFRNGDMQDFPAVDVMYLWVKNERWIELQLIVDWLTTLNKVDFLSAPPLHRVAALPWLFSHYYMTVQKIYAAT